MRWPSNQVVMYIACVLDRLDTDSPTMTVLAGRAICDHFNIMNILPQRIVWLGPWPGLSVWVGMGTRVVCWG